MSKIYKTARGKTLDMDKIKLSNERVTAVGNMKVNARGDKLGPGGKVVAGRNQVMDKIYSVEPSSGGYSPNDPATFAARKAEMESSRAKQLHDLATNLVQSGSIEASPPEEIAGNKPTTRGSLASSVAKPATVVQEPMPNPTESKGPTRI